MSTITKTVRLIMCDVDQNNNKFWTGTLYDNGDVHVEWGRVGKASQSKDHPSAGERFLDSKEKEKINKGYTHLKTITQSPDNKIVVVEQNDLKTVAKNQIKTKNPVLEKLIDRLVQYNIHKITSSTQIQFDVKTGLFSTPLGIVTREGIDEARTILANIKQAKQLSDVKQDISNYLRIIPQDIGMKFNVNNIFGSAELIIKQNDLLDSLESSYQATQVKPTATPNTPQESIFNVELDLITDTTELNRIIKKFNDTKKSMHVSSKLSVKNAYTVCINSVHEAFQTGKKVGNIQELWHGTKKGNLLSILKTGLKISPPSTATIAGALFGRGLYFSDQSTKSLNYAYGYWDGKYENDCFMFLCDVAMGKSFTPKNHYGSLPMTGYDSTYAIGGQSGVLNNEMIVYNENQADLKILVEFSS